MNWSQTHRRHILLAWIIERYTHMWQFSLNVKTWRTFSRSSSLWNSCKKSCKFYGRAPKKEPSWKSNYGVAECFEGRAFACVMAPRPRAGKDIFNTKHVHTSYQVENMRSNHTVPRNYIPVRLTRLWPKTSPRKFYISHDSTHVFDIPPALTCCLVSKAFETWVAREMSSFLQEVHGVAKSDCH